MESESPREAQGWHEAELYAEGNSEAMEDFMTGWRTADRLREATTDEWEYVPGAIYDDGRARVSFSGRIAPGYVKQYLSEGGEVLRRRVGPWEAVSDVS